MVASSQMAIPAWLPPPARVGLNLAAASDLRLLRWYGRGPMESYPDRKTGARLGLFECRVEETDVPYMLPRCAVWTQGEGVRNRHAELQTCTVRQLNEGRASGVYLTSRRLVYSDS